MDRAQGRCCMMKLKMEMRALGEDVIRASEGGREGKERRKKIYPHVWSFGLLLCLCKDGGCVVAGGWMDILSHARDSYLPR